MKGMGQKKKKRKERPHNPRRRGLMMEMGVIGSSSDYRLKN
jgi:hypothetical protein